MTTRGIRNLRELRRPRASPVSAEQVASERSSACTCAREEIAHTEFADICIGRETGRVRPPQRDETASLLRGNLQTRRAAPADGVVVGILGAGVHRTGGWNMSAALEDLLQLRA